MSGLERLVCPHCGLSPDERSRAVVSWLAPAVADRVAAVLLAVSRRFGVTVETILGPDRTGHVARARQVAEGAVWRVTDLSYPDIGRVFGGRHHTTILAGVRKAEAVYPSDIGVVVAAVEKENTHD